jgi:AraC-like DNA-binding protein
MKIKALVIEIGIKNINNLKKHLKSKSSEFLYASSFLDVIDRIHLDKVHAILFSDFRGIKSTIGYIKMFKATSPEFRLIILSNEKKINEDLKIYYIQRGVDAVISCFDIEKLNSYFLENLSKLINDDIISNEWSNCTKKAIRCLKNNYHIQSNLLKFVSANTDYSMSSISHSIKKDTGENFSNWVQKLRINGALELLKATEYSIKTISNQVGYKTLQGFNKVFKKKFGKTPANFRKNYE